MSQETEVISCPACNHLLRVPLDWLGQSVQCPECTAMFKAPIKVGDILTAPELISRPAPIVRTKRKTHDVMLLLPAFGLLLCGITGAIVNGFFISKLFFDRDGGREWASNQIMALRKIGLGTPGPPETEDQRNEQDSAEMLRLYRWVMPMSLCVSLGIFLGGLSIALGWNYRLAQLGCVLAMLNIAHGCCIPGVVAGFWCILMLNSDEGRGHFLKSSNPSNV
jgi:hypothetical protein